MITEECRNDSFKVVDKQKRRKEILFIMRDIDDSSRIMTAMEVANEMMTHGFVDRLDRNNAAPRLTEMCEDGIIVKVGKKLDRWTGRNVTCYKIREA